MLNQRSHRLNSVPAFEAMEPRLLLDSHPLVTEFMADNDTGLSTRVRDSVSNPFAGDYLTPDWIEIFNPTTGTVALDDYFLTDDAENPGKWAFPASTTLGAGEYVVVYASGENITDPALDETGRLHTNFGLSASGGEDLVLSYYDAGQSQYVPVTEYLDFPDQERDISFGLYEAATITPILPAYSFADIKVPTGAIAGWNAEVFTPSGWAVGETGVGFQNTAPGIFTTLYKAKSGISLADLAAAETMIATPSQQEAVYTSADSVVNYYDSGGHGHDESALEVRFPGINVADDFAILSEGLVVIPAAGEYTFSVGSDDGFRLTIDGAVTTAVYNSHLAAGGDSINYTGARGFGDTLGVFSFSSAGLYALELVMFERGGGAAVEMWAAPGSYSAWSSAFDLVGNTAEGGLDLCYNPGEGGASSGYADDIHTDVETAMYGLHDTVYLRLEFDVADPADYDSLYLRMKYDDGFVAYLNGVKVAERNAPATPAWNSSATGTHPNADAAIWADINISGDLGLLHAGTNVLAIQGLNAPTDGGDLLVLPELADIENLGVQQFYFATPSPEGVNLDAYVAMVDDTAFDHDRGYYTEAFDVAITSDTEGAAIYWTTDGSSPLAPDNTPAAGATLYIEGNPGHVPHITTSTALRAVAIKDNYLPTNIDSQTYIFLADVITQPNDPDGWPTIWEGTTTTADPAADYEMDPDITTNPEYADMLVDSLTSLPTMSLVMDIDDLFGSNEGIYSNPWQQGESWERAASIEMFYPDGYDAPDDGFQLNCGIRLYGGVGRREDCLKHSFRLLFKGDYGPTKLEYDLLDNGAVDSFDTLILRSNFNDGYSWHWGDPKDVQYIRDEYARRLSTALGARSATGTYVHLYVNGLYWGLYNPTERPDQSFGPPYFGGGDKDDWDAVNSGAPTGESDTEEYSDLMSYVQNNDMTQDVHYQYIQGNNADGTPNPNIPCLLDMDNYARFMFANFYVGNRDWPSHNWYAARPEDPGSTGYKSFTWDAEWVILMNSSLTENRTGVTNSIAEPYEHLRYNEDFQLLFADIAHWAFSPGGPLYVNPDAPAWDPAHPENNQPAALYAELADWVELSMVAESARWGDIGHPNDPATLDDWQDERDTILGTYMPQRSDIVLGQLRGANLYPDVDAPVFEVNGTPLYGGTVSDGDSLTLTSAETTIYYTLDGTDPRAFNGTVSGSALPYGGAIALAENKHVRARVYAGGEWSALADAYFILGMDDLRITEIMYNPADPTPAEMTAGFTDSDDFEFIELQNIGDDPISLAGLGFYNGVDFTFPIVTLNPGAYAIVVSNQDAFEFRYGTGLNVVGTFVGGTNLANNGEELELANCFGGEILEFDYDDGWFDHTDGDGFSLVIADPAQDPALWDTKSGWKASWQVGGNPGAADPGPDLHAIVINEVRAHSPDADPDGDWIELYNASDDTINITGWYLSDDPANPMKYCIGTGDTTLSPGEYRVFTQAANFGVGATDPGSTAGFGLSEFGSEFGDVICLTSADGGVLAGFREDEFFGASLTGDTFGRHIVASTGDKEFVRLASPTKGYLNDDPLIPDVVINEIMYNPAEEPTAGNEYIELYNRTGADVPLYDPAHSANTYMFTNGVEFTFPTGAAVPAGGYALVVGIDPATFRTTYGIPASVPIYGPYARDLANDGERLTLSFPGEPEYSNPPPGEDPGYVPYILLETVSYNDKTPWPTRADGDGSSLERVDPDSFSDDVANWQASTAGGSPGALNVGMDETPPTAPTALAGVHVGETIVELTWSPATDPDSGVAGYRVYRDTILIGDTTDLAYCDMPLTSPADDATYEVAAYNIDGVEGPTSDPLVVSSLLVDSIEVLDEYHLNVVFTREVNQSTAEDEANYHLIAGEGTVLDISIANLRSDDLTVRLSLADPLVDGATHALTVSGIVAEDGTPIAPGTCRVFHYGAATTGSIFREYWLGISENSVSYLTDDPDYPDSPDGWDWRTSFEAPINWADNYGTRMYGWVVPEISDYYTFWITSDDNSELWLSTDDNSANKAMVANVSAWTSSRDWDDADAHPSDPIYLEAGQRYYIEALQKEGGGGDNLAVAWTRPGVQPTVPIPGQYLIPAMYNYFPNTIVSVEATDPDADEEGTDPGQFTVTRTGSTAVDLLVYYTLTGSAEADDYQPLSGYVTIPSGQSSATVDVTPVDDPDDEEDETVVLNLAFGEVYNVGTAAAIMTLADNDVTVDDPPYIVAAGIALNPGAGRPDRTLSQTDPSGLGVQTVTVAFSEAVTIAAGAVTVQKVHFDAGIETIDYTFAPAEVSLDGSGTATLTLTILDSHQTAVDTWVKVTLADDDALLADLQGNALDGEPAADASGLGYLYDADLDLPSGNGVAGGEAVFYVGSLRGDYRDDSLFNPGGPDGHISTSDIDGFTAAYQQSSLDADFRDDSLFNPGGPDGNVTTSDIDGFTAAYQAGASLEALPTVGTLAAAPPTPLPITALAATVPTDPADDDGDGALAATGASADPAMTVAAAPTLTVEEDDDTASPEPWTPAAAATGTDAAATDLDATGGVVDLLTLPALDLIVGQ